MRLMGRLSHWGCFVFTLIASFSACGQSDVNLEQGLKPYGAFHGGDLDSVGLANGNLNLHIPLVSYPQRGGKLNLGFFVRYNNKGWTEVQCGTGCYHVAFNRSAIVEVVRDQTLHFFTTRYHFNSLNPDQPGGYYANVNNVVTADGGTHMVTGTMNRLNGQNLGAQVSLDGTGIVSTGVPAGTVGDLLDSRGIRYTVGVSALNGESSEDPNGNKITADANGWIDTVGRRIPGSVQSGTDGTYGKYYENGQAANALLPGVPDINPVDLARCPDSGYQNGQKSVRSWSLPAPIGGTSTVLTCYADVFYQTSFGISGVAEAQGIVKLLTKIILPNQTYWAFTYNNYMDLTSVHLPTGGTVSYTWFNPVPGIVESRSVQTRTVDDGTGVKTWTYAYNVSVAQYPNWFTRVTDPDGNDTLHAMSGGYEVKTLYFQGSSNGGTLLKTVDTVYSSSANPFDEYTQASTSTNVVPTQITTTLPSGQVSQVVRTYDAGGSYTFYDYYNLDPLSGLATASTHPFIRGALLREAEYDYGQGSPGPLLRKTFYGYKYLDDTSNTYLGFNLIGLISRQTICSPAQGGETAGDCPDDASLKKRAETDYGYDETSLASSGVSPSLLDPAVPNGGYRGNQTSLKRWLNTTNSLLSTTTSYFDSGMANMVADPLNHATTYSYGTSFTSNDFAGAYVTQIADALGHAIKFDYDFNTGLQTAIRDPNNQTMTSDFDSMWRPQHKNSPDGGTVTWTYNDSTPPAVTVTSAITNSVSHSIEADMDGLGRLKRTQLLSDPEGVVYTDITYDSLGRTHTSSNPYRSIGESTYGVTTTDYDALGRGKKITQADALTVLTDYSGNVTTVTDESGRQRRAVSDAIGRLIEVDEQTQQTLPATPGSPATQSTGSITINGSEQATQVLTSGATSGSGSVMITGTEQALIVDCDPKCITVYDFGTVTLTINGYTASVPYNNTTNTGDSIAPNLASILQNDGASPVWASSSGGTIWFTARAQGAATNYSWSSSSATGRPQIFSEPSFVVVPSTGALSGGQDNIYTTVYDSGTVSLTVNGHTNQVTWGQGSTAASIASALAANVNSDGGAPVTASPSGGTVFLTSRGSGTAANYSLSTAWSFDSGHFGGSSFTTSNSGSAMTGGADAVPSTPAQTIWTFSPQLVTTYGYDALGNLTRVDQKGNDSNAANWRTRTFAYDSLSRLTSASNPESGTITYTYNGDGTLASKTAPAPNQTGTATVTLSFCYDEVHRLKSKAYNLQNCPMPDGVPAATYTYDLPSYNGLTITNPIGRRVGMSDASGMTAWSYDSMGRVAKEQRTISGITKTISYQYDYAGALKQLAYPDGEVLDFASNAAGHPLSAIDNTLNINFAKNAAYSPVGALASAQFGSTTSSTGITVTNTYNKRLQPNTLSAATTSQTVMSLNYDFGLGSADNGNILSITNNKDTTRSASFAYDQLNRLTSAMTTSNRWGNTYDYDPWGNLLHKNQVAGKLAGEYFQQSADGNNRIAGYCYDAGGNLLNQGPCGANQYQYDAENRITSVAGVTYTYDGDGKRVKKSNGTLYWGDGPLAESDLSGALQRNFIFFGGKRIARRDLPSGAVHYYFSDHLGSADVVTSASGTIENESDYYPWGGEMVITQSLANQNYKFTGKERDTESGLDYFGARFYANQMGRWMSPDWADVPEPIPYADLTDPQSLNLYGYVRNNPMSHADADGHDTISYLLGAANAWASDNLGGWGRTEINDPDFQRGQELGDKVAIAQGVSEASAGEAGAGGGTVLVFTGVAAPEGAVVLTGSALLEVHGTATAVTATLHLAKSKSGNYELTPENRQKMEQGNAPTGTDGHAVERHHPNQDGKAKPVEKTRTDHRLGENYKKNHPHTNKRPSQVDRGKSRADNKKYWKDQAKKESN